MVMGVLSAFLGLSWQYREGTGLVAVLLGSDYPHEESTFPRSREILEALLKGS